MVFILQGLGSNMSGLRFATEFLFYLLSCLIAVVSFIYINYVFVKKSFNSVINILTSYILYFFILLSLFFLPCIYISVIARFPSSVWASDDAAISLVFWVFLVLPCFAAEVAVPSWTDVGLRAPGATTMPRRLSGGPSATTAFGGRSPT